MKVDISGLIDAVSMIVDFMKSLKFTLGSHTVSLWMIIISLGTMDAISFILGMKKKKDD